MRRQDKLKSIEQYGKMYVQKYLAEARKRHEAIVSDPLEALAFMYGKVFMRGRRDGVSIAFRNRTLAALQKYNTLQDIDPNGLEAYLHNRGVNNRHDRRMVRESISFITNDLQDYNCNVFNWAVEAIQRQKSAEAFAALVSIHAIGNKLATFYLGDVTLLEDIEDSIRGEDYGYFQPIDTWVEQVTRTLGITDEDDQSKISVIKDKIIRECLAAEVSQLLFNAGAWMVGANAYSLLLTS